MTFLVTLAVGLAVVFSAWATEDDVLSSQGYQEGTKRQQRNDRAAMFRIPICIAVAVAAQLIVNQIVV